MPTQLDGFKWAIGLRAMLIFAWILYAMILAIRHYKRQPVVYWGWIVSFILVTLQAVVGVLVVFTNASLAMALLHSLFISCLFAVLCYLVMLGTSKVNEKPNQLLNKQNNLKLKSLANSAGIFTIKSCIYHSSFLISV